MPTGFPSVKGQGATDVSSTRNETGVYKDLSHVTMYHVVYITLHYFILVMSGVAGAGLSEQPGGGARRLIQNLRRRPRRVKGTRRLLRPASGPWASCWRTPSPPRWMWAEGRRKAMMQEPNRMLSTTWAPTAGGSPQHVIGCCSHSAGKGHVEALQYLIGPKLPDVQASRGDKLQETMNFCRLPRGPPPRPAGEGGCGKREREREGGGFGGFPGGLASCNELGMEKAKQQHVYSSLFARGVLREAIHVSVLSG